MLIKAAPYLHQENAKLGIEYGYFFDVLVLILNTKFVTNSTIRRFRSGIKIMMQLICIKYNANFSHIAFSAPHTAEN